MELQEASPVTLFLTPADIDILAEGSQLPRDPECETPIEEVMPGRVRHAEKLGQRIQEINHMLSGDTAESDIFTDDELYVEFGGHLSATAVFAAWALRSYNRARTSGDRKRCAQGKRLIESISRIVCTDEIEHLQYIQVVPEAKPGSEDLLVAIGALLGE